jgi:hypothetical protein
MRFGRIVFGIAAAYGRSSSGPFFPRAGDPDIHILTSKDPSPTLAVFTELASWTRGSWPLFAVLTGA